MHTLRIDTTCTENGVIVLRDLAFHVGDTMEIVVIPRSSAPSTLKHFPLREESIEYHLPFEPVSETDWEAAR